jgi:hypothetical protein
MTTETISAAMVPLHAAWRSLLWFVPLTALWILLIYRWPAILASGVPTTTHQLAAHGLVALGLWLGLERTSLTPGQRRATWLAIMIPDTLWFAVAWSAAINGIFHPGTTPLPVLPLAILPAGDHRRSTVAVLEAHRAGTRRDALRVGSSRFSSTAYSAAGRSQPGCTVLLLSTDKRPMRASFVGRAALLRSIFRRDKLAA